jgi:hypothetical protein
MLGTASLTFSYTTRVFVDVYINSPSLEDYIGRWLDGHIDIWLLDRRVRMARGLLRFADVAGS